MEGCGFRDGRMPDTGGEGRRRDDFLVGVMELFKAHGDDISVQCNYIRKLYNKPFHSLVSSFWLQLEGRRWRREVVNEDACLFHCWGWWWWRRWRR